MPSVICNQPNEKMPDDQPSLAITADSMSTYKRTPEELKQQSEHDEQNESNKRARTSVVTNESHTTHMSTHVMNNPTVQNVEQLNQQNIVTSATNKSVILLSVTKVEPSYTEPWRKMSPVSLHGTGVLFDWNSFNRNTDTNIQHSNIADSIGILTTASTVHHATSIRAVIPSSSLPLSVSCAIEWISLPMNLAILKLTSHVNYDWMTSILHDCPIISDRLPKTGEYVKIYGLSRTPIDTASTSYGIRGEKKYLHTYSIGNIMNYFAIEDNYFMLRMNVSMSSSVSAGGVVADNSGRIVGLMVSNTVAIPGIVFHQFMNQYKDILSTSVGTDKHSCSTTSETDATPECCHKACEDEATSHSERETAGKVSLSSAGSKQDSVELNHHLLGIASLGITGYQALENKAIRKSFGVDPDGVDGVRITGVYHTAHPSTNPNSEYDIAHCNRVESQCYPSPLRVDDILLKVNNEPVIFDGTVKVAPYLEDERVSFQWLVSRCKPGTQVKMEVIRQKKRMQLSTSLSQLRYLIPRTDEEKADELPAYVTVGGCLFVPLSHAWIAESRKRNPSFPLEGYHRYLKEQRKGDQQLIILSRVLADDVNLGYHEMRDLLLTSVNNQRLTNMRHLVDILVKNQKGSNLEFRFSDIHSGRSKIVICMDTKEVMSAESGILSRHMIDAWCSPNALAPGLKRESERKAHRHGVTCGLKTLRALRNAISETIIVVQKPKSPDERIISTTKRILNLSEVHKMQSAPNFSGKYVEDVGWTQVKTKHLSQLCICGKSTRFYCICSVGVMRCKDCFLKHCRDHMSNDPEDGCDVCGGKTELLAEGIDLVTSKKRKPNNPNQASQSRCIVCKAKTCLCCSACGDEPEVPLCDVTTGRNCLAIHISEQHGCTHTQCSTTESVQHTS